MSKLGEKKTNRYGDTARIVNWRSNEDIDIIFENDSVVTTTYDRFKNGLVAKPDTVAEESWIGVDVTDAYEDKATIVEFTSETDVTVQYKDGTIISRLTLEDVINSNFDKEEHIGDKKEGATGISAERKRTYDNVMYMLQRFRRCVMIRPCGFGKTIIGLKIFQSERYEKCLFLHPNKDDLNAHTIKSTSGKKIDAHTYNWLYMLSDRDIANLDYDIVFLDEVHGVGGTEDKGAIETYRAVKQLMETHPKTHFLGATATPLRMDGINVVHTMFDDRVCYPYTQADAFDDGILNKPHYFYCVYDAVKKIRDAIGGDKKENIDMSRDELKAALNLSDDEIDEIDSRFMDKHISEVCHRVFPKKKYLRFIAFYLTNEEIVRNKAKVIGWFKAAYPNYQINSIIVTSRSEKNLSDVDALPTEPDPGYEGRIDIIFNCRMLCMGYHSEHITGLILDRKTQSIALYTQMIGRLLSCDSKEPVIIFDIVDNIHSDFVFTVPEAVDAKKVIPVFNKKAETYKEVEAKYPRARDWDEIEKNNKKARVSENLYRSYYRDESVRKPEPVQKSITPTHKDDTVTSATSYTPSYLNTPLKGTDRYSTPVRVNSPISVKSNFTPASSVITTTKTEEPEDTKQKIKDAWDIVKEANLSFADACNYLAGIEREYGDLNIFAENESVPKAEDISNDEFTSEDIQKTTADPDAPVAFVKNPVPTTEAPKPEKQDTNSDLGYAHWGYYYNFDTKELYSKNLIMENKHADFEDEYINKWLKRVEEERYKNAIKKWHTLPGCDTDYQSYKEVDKTSDKYKYLRSASEHCFGVPVELVLQYMIEKEAG